MPHLLYLLMHSTRKRAVTTTTTNARGGTVYRRSRKFLSDSSSGLGNGTLLLVLPATGLELRIEGELVWCGDCEGVRCVEGGGGEGRGVPADTVLY
jgi:hypothetical protein